MSSLGLKLNQQIRGKTGTIKGQLKVEVSGLHSLAAWRSSSPLSSKLQCLSLYLPFWKSDSGIQGCQLDSERM